MGISRFIQASLFTLALAAAIAIVAANQQTVLSPPAPKGWNGSLTITVNGVKRTVGVFGPGTTTYTCPPPYPIIVAFHGRGATWKRMQNISYFDDHKFCAIVLYPQGLPGIPRLANQALKSCWEGTPYCTPTVPGTSPPVTRNDVGFFDSLLDLAAAEYGAWADASRVYVAGKSNGGHFANHLACHPSASRRIAAIAPVSGPFYWATDTLEADPSCSPARPMPVINFHGDADIMVPYNGSLDWQSCTNSPLCPSPSVQANVPSIPNWVTAWSALNNCTYHSAAVPEPGATQPSLDQETFRTTHSDCRGGVEVRHYYTRNGRHDWLSRSPNRDNIRDADGGGSSGAAPFLGTMEASEAIFEFFMRFRRVA